MRFDIVSGQFEETDGAPDKPAVIGSDGVLSWSVFKTRCESLAAMISVLGLPAGHPIIVRGHKEAEMVCAMTACMMLGHPYIPLDVVVPMDRVMRIRAITGSSLIIDHTDEGFANDVPFVIQRGMVRRNAAAAMGAGVPDRPSDPIRYIIFTSGSTGEPKGVRITREAAALTAGGTSAS